MRLVVVLKAFEVIVALGSFGFGTTMAAWAIALFSFRTREYPERYMDEKGRSITSYRRVAMRLNIPGFRGKMRRVTYSPAAVLGHALAAAGCFVLAGWFGVLAIRG